jgi:hypothetical protein
VVRLVDTNAGLKPFEAPFGTQGKQGKLALHLRIRKIQGREKV